MQRVALYIRVSTDEQKIHGLSIEAQTEALDAWAKVEKVKVVGHYIDAGISARKKHNKRPELMRLLSDIQGNKIDLVVFTKLDRWFRNISEYYKVQDILEANHVGWKTIHEDYDTTTASGRFKINIMLSVAQDEADRTGERIKAVFESKKDRLEPVTGHVPTGYVIKNKRMEKDPATEQAVSAFFEKYLTCKSISKTIDFVAKSYGMHIKTQLANAMLSKSAYYGKFHNADGMCPPYITLSQHNEIESSRHRMARKTVKNRIYIFSGLITCGCCGARMGARMHKFPRYAERGDEKAEYNCPAHAQKKGCSNRVNIREEAIEQFLLDNAEAKLKRTVVAYKSEKEKAQNYAFEISSTRKKLTKLKDLYVNDLINLNEYKADYEKYTSALNDLLEKSNETQRHNTPENAFVSGWKELYSELDRQRKREFWSRMIKEVRVYPDRHIEFDFL